MNQRSSDTEHMRHDAHAKIPRRSAPAPTLLLAAAAFGCAAGPVPETAPAAADPEGGGAAMSASFTEEQVERGRLDFGILCGECHSTSEFRGSDFQFRWRRRTAWDLFRSVSMNMPENAPGSLSDREYVGVITYILEMNGYSPGDAELPATEAALDQFPLDGGIPRARDHRRPETRARWPG